MVTCNSTTTNTHTDRMQCCFHRKIVTRMRHNVTLYALCLPC